ncbi:hypothetical protein N7472_007388 [Penicillium cf. griseofulvum]|uniref:Transcription factor domain-containing protein n=1 Tax=Penicillium cf. griseofulvum TaxID=2972120 RepID=A0A9W9J252_9EURO|nr:hypothetical protein N7472_007388 [Penicillium cf. griseofulvum]KAJ5451931.1 hypothetical protein N7445_000114 [Penicillium cf. griseofulvum]
MDNESVHTSLECIDIVSGFRLTFEEADGALSMYQSLYTPYFPFVPVPVTMTANEMHDRTPFLLRTILLVTVSQSLSIQKAAQLWFRQQIAQRVVVDQERRLELLQAILVFVAWGNFQFYIESQATDLLQLAGVIVVDLGLDKSPDSLVSSRLSFVPTAIRKVKGLIREGHAPDDRRAMLGCFYLNSVDTLSKNTELGEYDSDKFLVVLVRIQQLVMRVSDALPSPELNDNAGNSLDAPLHMIMATARNQLDALVQNQPLKVGCNVLLWVHYYGALMRLYEPAIHMRSSGSSSGPLGSIRRTEALWGCLQAARDFFTTYTTIPLDIISSMPLVATAYMSFAVVTSSMILLLDDSDWDINLARKSFDFAAACQSLGDRFREGDQVAQSLGRRQKFEENGKSVLDAYHMKIMWIRHWYTSKISTVLPGGTTMDSRPLSSTTIGSTSQPMDVDQHSHQQHPLEDPSVFPPIDLDEDFWRAILDNDGPTQWTA